MNVWLVATSIVLFVPTGINQKNVYSGTIRNVGLEKTNTNKRD